MDILLSLLLPLAARAIENVECALALAEPREYVIAKDLPPVTLSPGQVLIRGELRRLFLTETNKALFAVVDDLDKQRVFAKSEHATFELAPGDEIYVQPPAPARYVGKWIYDFGREERRVMVRGEEHLVPIRRPYFLRRAGDFSSLLSLEAVIASFKAAMPVTVVKRLDPDDYALTRERVMAAFAALAAHQANPDRFVRISPEVTIELAHYEEALPPGRFAFVIDPPQSLARLRFRNGELSEPRLVYPMHLKLIRDDGTEVPVVEGDHIYVTDKDGRLRYDAVIRQAPLQLFKPYAPNEEELVRKVFHLKRMVIVRAKRST